MDEKKNDAGTVAQQRLSRFWALFLAFAILVILSVLFSHWGRTTHEEPIVYREYLEGAEEGAYVTIEAVSAEVVAYTAETRTSSYRTGSTRVSIKTTTHYAYILLTAEDGSEAVGVRHLTVSEAAASAVEKARMLNDFVRENEALAELVSTQGSTFYGRIIKNRAKEQSPDALIGSLFTPFDIPQAGDDPLAFPARAGDRNRASMYTAVNLYNDGAVPHTFTVRDPLTLRGTGPYVIGLAVGVAFLVRALRLRRIREELARQERIRRAAAEQARKAALLEEERRRKQEAAERAKREAEEKRRKEEEARRRTRLESQLEQEKERYSGEIEGALRQLIPDFDAKQDRDLVAVLLASDPEEIQARIRGADRVTLEIFARHLTAESIGRTREDAEILAAVKKYTLEAIAKLPPEETETTGI